MLVSSSNASAFKRLMLAAAASAALVSCASAPVVVAEGLSPPELIQRAQDAYDRDRYEAAISFYEALRSRFPNDLASQCAADYEIAFIRYKQQRFDEAKIGFRSLLERYRSEDAALLPAHYKVLGEKILAKIELGK